MAQHASIWDARCPWETAVMDGRRNLAPSTASRVAAALQMFYERAEYFCALVALNQAKETTERRLALARVRRLRRQRDVHGLEAARDLYHSNWYIPAIRELAAAEHFRADMHLQRQPAINNRVPPNIRDPRIRRLG